jgi:hypothetical protein
MWIVELALRRPLSAAVMALLMLVLGALSLAMMNVRHFFHDQPDDGLQLSRALGDRHGAAHRAHHHAPTRPLFTASSTSNPNSLQPDAGGGIRADWVTVRRVPEDRGDQLTIDGFSPNA